MQTEMPPQPSAGAQKTQKKPKRTEYLDPDYGMVAVIASAVSASEK